MPADRGNIGMGRRRQGPTEPERTDNRPRVLERDIDEADVREAADTLHDPGRQPGAFGKRTPHTPLKKGVRADLERLDVREGEQEEER